MTKESDEKSRRIATYSMVVTVLLALFATYGKATQLQERVFQNTQKIQEMKTEHKEAVLRLGKLEVNLEKINTNLEYIKKILQAIKEKK